MHLHWDLIIRGVEIKNSWVLIISLGYCVEIGLIELDIIWLSVCLFLWSMDTHTGCRYDKYGDATDPKEVGHMDTVT